MLRLVIAFFIRPHPSSIVLGISRSAGCSTATCLAVLVLGQPPCPPVHAPFRTAVNEECKEHGGPPQVAKRARTILGEKLVELGVVESSVCPREQRGWSGPQASPRLDPASCDSPLHLPPVACPIAVCQSTHPLDARSRYNCSSPIALCQASDLACVRPASLPCRISRGPCAYSPRTHSSHFVNLSMQQSLKRQSSTLRTHVP